MKIVITETKTIKHVFVVDRGWPDICQVDEDAALLEISKAAMDIGFESLPATKSVITEHKVMDSLGRDIFDPDYKTVINAK